MLIKKELKKNYKFFNIFCHFYNELSKDNIDIFLSKKPTIESLQKQLTEERATYKAELSKIASQKMTEFINYMATKN